MFAKVTQNVGILTIIQSSRSLCDKMCAVDRMWRWLHVQFKSPVLLRLMCWSAKRRTNNIRACCCCFSHSFQANAVSSLKLCNDRSLLCLLTH